MKAHDLAKRFAETGAPPTQEQVLAQAERARSNTELLHVWRDAQRSRRPGWVPALPASGKTKQHLRTLGDAVPEGTLGMVIAMLGMRWDSFCQYLVTERGWSRDVMGQQPSLPLAASQLEAVCAWIAQQGDDAPQSYDPSTEDEAEGESPNEKLERLWNESQR